MSTKIPLELSSTLDATEQATLLLGASAEVSPYSNETPTAGKAPVLVSIAANRTVDADDFAKLMLENGNQGTLPQPCFLHSSHTLPCESRAWKGGAAKPPRSLQTTLTSHIFSLHSH